MSSSTEYRELEESLRPTANTKLFYSISTVIDTSEFREIVAHRLSAAVKIPTVVGDGMGHVEEDPQWEVFYEFSEFLRNTFPTIYKHLDYTIINEHGHIFTWEGSDPSLKPLLMMAHSDVVPVSVSSTDTWTYAPFSGHYDGKYIWGRGSEDDKSNLVTILSTIELLLNGSFNPSRTIIVAIGFDEEGGAEKSFGAQCIAEVLLQRYGKDGIELIFDEGVAGLETKSGVEFAFPATSEKGYMDVTVRINTPGGHSQDPPKHTGIGYLAQAIQIIEENPLPPVVSVDNLAFAYLQKAALHCNEPADVFRCDIEHKTSTGELMYMTEPSEIRTTTAVTVVHGGDKVNSLPESAYALVNHRIAPHDSVQVVKDHYLSILMPWAKKHKLSVYAFGKNLSQSCDVHAALVLTSDYDLDPSPITDSNDQRFKLLADTIRGVFGDNVVVTPTLLLGNTDTRYYWDLSNQIYRMSPWRANHDPRGTRMHTVDERMPIAGLMEMVRFYHTFILNVDEYRS
ncbi:hypothetical protein B7463_g7549, partial [Scytalidium lignicola]